MGGSKVVEAIQIRNNVVHSKEGLMLVKGKMKADLISLRDGGIYHNHISDLKIRNAVRGTIAGSEDDILLERGTPCSQDNCRSVAVCPRGTSVIGCTSEPANGGDGIQLETNSGCIARGSKAGSSITAIAKCSSLGTSVKVSNSIFLDAQVVRASCESGRVIGCYCHSPWSASVCGGSAVFAPSDGACSKTIPRTPTENVERRLVQGAGAKIYALCEDIASSSSLGNLR